MVTGFEVVGVVTGIPALIPLIAKAYTELYQAVNHYRNFDEHLSNLLMMIATEVLTSRSLMDRLLRDIDEDRRRLLMEGVNVDDETLRLEIEASLGDLAETVLAHVVCLHKTFEQIESVLQSINPDPSPNPTAQKTSIHWALRKVRAEIGPSVHHLCSTNDFRLSANCKAEPPNKPPLPGQVSAEDSDSQSWIPPRNSRLFGRSLENKIRPYSNASLWIDSRNATVLQRPIQQRSHQHLIQ